MWPASERISNQGGFFMALDPARPIAAGEPALQMIVPRCILCMEQQAKRYPAEGRLSGGTVRGQACFLPRDEFAAQVGPLPALYLIRKMVTQ
jgi:hypothetical protein